MCKLYIGFLKQDKISYQPCNTSTIINHLFTIFNHIKSQKTLLCTESGFNPNGVCSTNVSVDIRQLDILPKSKLPKSMTQHLESKPLSTASLSKKRGNPYHFSTKMRFQKVIGMGLHLSPKQNPTAAIESGLRTQLMDPTSCCKKRCPHRGHAKKT